MKHFAGRVLKAALLLMLLPAPALAGEVNDAFLSYMMEWEKNPEAGARDVVAMLNRRAVSPMTINQLLQDSEFMSARQYAVHEDFVFLLRQLRAKGYGSGRFEKWDFQMMPGHCEHPTAVFYSWLLHGGRRVLYGFHMTSEGGLLTPRQLGKGLAGKALGLSCEYPELR